MGSGRARRVTIADVAARAGVSPGAVSFALNDRPGVGALTRRRILDAAAELDWTPNLRARSLSRSRAFAVGLVLARRPETLGADPFFPAFIAGVESTLVGLGYSLVLTMVPDAEAEVRAYRRMASEGRVDGVFLTDLRRHDPRIALLTELGLPTVTLGRPDVESPFPTVRLDDTAGVIELVEALLGRGHTSIAHVSGPVQFLHVRSRCTAWRQTLVRAQVRPGPVVAADFSAAGGAAATERLLRSAEPPTAIVYGNDVMAIAGMAVAQQHRVAVPQRLSITGFDDIDLASHVHPALSTVRNNPFEWGRTSARVLLDLVDGRPAHDIDLPAAQVIMRSSIARAPRTKSQQRRQENP